MEFHTHMKHVRNMQCVLYPLKERLSVIYLCKPKKVYGLLLISLKLGYFVKEFWVTLVDREPMAVSLTLIRDRFEAYAKLLLWPAPSLRRLIFGPFTFGSRKEALCVSTSFIRFPAALVFTLLPIIQILSARTVFALMFKPSNHPQRICFFISLFTRVSWYPNPFDPIA